MNDSRLQRSKIAAALYLFFGAALPFAAAVTYVHLWGVNIPVNDEWNFMPTIEAFYGGGNWPAMVIDHYGEHRIPIPKLIILGLAPLTHYNVKTEMYLSACLMLVCALVCWYLLRQTNGPAWLFLPIGWLLLSTAQYQNLLVGWQFQIPLMNCFALIAVWLLSKRAVRWTHHAGAIGCAVAATFSFANGLMLWPAAIYVVWARDRSIRKTLIWCGAMIVAVSAYAAGYSGFHRTPNDRTPEYLAAITKSPGGVLGLFLAIVGNNLGGGKVASSIVAGCMLLLLLLLLFICRNHDETNHRPQLTSYPWIGLIILSLLSAVAIAFGRSLAWREFATSSRYLTATIFIPVSLLVIAADRFRRLPRLSRGVRTTGAIFIAVCLLFAGYQYLKGARLGWLVGRASRSQNVATRLCLLSYRTAPDECLEKLYAGDARWVRNHATTLERWRLGPFATPTPSATPSLEDLDENTGEIEGTLDMARFESQPDGGAVVIFEGWSMVGKRGPPATVAFLLDDKPIGETSYFIARPDVAQFVGREIPPVGWEFRTRIEHPTRGRHTAEVILTSRTARRLGTLARKEIWY